MLKKMRNLPINSCKDDTSSESRDSDDSSNDFSASVEESFEVMFVPEEEIQQVNQVWGNQWEETFYNRGGRGGGGGGGGDWLSFGAYFTHFPAPPPLQVIIAQSPNVWWKNT